MVLRICVGAIAARVATVAALGLAVTPALSQQQGTLVWGGAMPAPGEAYRPSPSAVDMIDTNVAPLQLAPAPQIIPQANPVPEIVPEAAAADSLANDLVGLSVPTPQPSALLPVSQEAPTLAPPQMLRETQPPAAPPVPVPMRDADTLFGGTTEPEPPRRDPWAAMKAVTPGAVTEADRRRLERRTPVRVEAAYASLERAPAPRLEEPVRRTAPPVTGTPSGWRNLSKKEALCRAALVQLGVEFTEPSPIRASKSCGIPNPIKVTRIAKGVAMSPAATLNCDAVFRISRWVDQEVKPAARSALGSHLVALRNSSSYRCSRVAGSGGLSQHATGNALDVAAFVMANGEAIDVEKKGIFSPREQAFQTKVRRSACRWFGTVLGPGYDYLHRNHFHLDAREREKTFCR
ncbi:extensin family protein [Fulvimarina sp. 2208YS6-2-32]|uniref:Extensin family protein n=1 Tax=Fulvimarina uroteuthidis TaxID=3098149 RepID=A0ABU5I0Q3_9HYPH|nr:extensin family protein [Fulvimarina sp. 2208YS6-2-32]MDY8108384.1 extensin family protein [Fulvimarina sp. 2208YS6-2-32]